MNMGWSRGYVSDSPYVTSYQPHQTPGFLALACAVQGVLWEPGHRLSIADLGCGRGLTACTLAAANPDWTVVGLDYNPAHIADARSLAAESRLSNVDFREVDLADMSDAELDALPEFDVVTLHGLWSWVSDDVRGGVLRFLRRKLRAGGIAHVSYNALPGWAGGIGQQRMLATVAEGRTGNTVDRAADALEVVRALAKTGARALDGSVARKFLDENASLDPSYLAHEFLNAHWRPTFFADVAAAMAGAKLDYVGAVRLRENFDGLMLSAAQRDIQLALPPGAARELVKDTCIIRTFREDVFMRGIVAADRGELCGRITLALTARLPADHPKRRPSVEAVDGEMTLPDAVIDPILAALDERPRRVSELLDLPTSRKTNGAELLMLLTGSGRAQPVWNPGEADTGRIASAARFNDAVARRHGGGGHAPGRYVLASPVLGAGLGCGTLEIEIAARLRDGEAPDPEDLADKLLPSEATPEARETAVATIGRLLSERLDVFRTLGIV